MKKKYFILLISFLISLNGIGQNIQLHISGNSNKETKVIDSISYSKLHLDINSIKKETDSLQKRLFHLGFIENELLELTKINDTLYHSKFSLKNKYKEIHIYYNEEYVSKNILNKVSSKVYQDYFILPFPKIENALYTINSLISDLGFPFSEIQLKDIRIKSSKTIQAHLGLNSNTNKREIDKIVIKGYTKFPKAYLKHYLKIKTNTTFNLSEIKNKTKTLNQLRFARQIKDPEVLFTKDSTILYLYLEKTKSNSFDGFLGFGTNKTTNKIDFNGYLNLNLNNNLNTGEAFNLVYKSDENEQKTFQANLSLPYLFNSPLGVEVGLDIFKKDSSFTTVKQVAKLFYILNTKTNIYLGIKRSKSNNLLDEENSTQQIQDYSANIYTVRYLFQNRQSSRLFNKNALIDLELGTGNRTFTNNKENQTQVSLDAFKIFNLNSKNSAFIRINGAGIFTNTFLENELIRFGGINSIRGFEENSLAASMFGLINTEYRYQLSNSLYIHSIIDFSYFENKLHSQKEKLYGFGFGFGLLTKAGLLKFNYANGKNENQKFKFSNSKIHLSLTAYF